MVETQNFPYQFDHEEKIYQQLRTLQGCVIPVFYGEGRMCGDGKRTIVLPDVGGANPYSEQFGRVTETAIKEKLQPAIGAILELGVEPGDHNPRNYHIAGDDAAFVVDFEDTADVDPERVEELTDAVGDGVAYLGRILSQMQRR
ncbi:hypothetical protein B0H63DRAFT_453444 [Podospora didyma]|uniref:Uncharacterized protein n=1 Tax=Podospora didyma TaxID=330526 RepID=A0AAE0N635_9PEZI|nr:hypothetical protein B0H63DRAFT_453444 [Podospora didyma]